MGSGQKERNRLPVYDIKYLGPPTAHVPPMAPRAPSHLVRGHNATGPWYFVGSPINSRKSASHHGAKPRAQKKQSQGNKITVYIFNKYISPRKTISNALTAIYGIGIKRALAVCNALCINPKKRFSELSLTHASRIQKCITNGPEISPRNNTTWAQAKVGSRLRKEINDNIKRYMKIRTFRGLRHKNSLPVRGQRTHTNARTQKKNIK